MFRPPRLLFAPLVTLAAMVGVMTGNASLFLPGLGLADATGRRQATPRDLRRAAPRVKPDPVPNPVSRQVRRANERRGTSRYLPVPAYRRPTGLKLRHNPNAPRHVSGTRFKARIMRDVA